ncbi:MAG TPA: PQQ-binding-like beta-propeller repeat protein [Vicinamibacterales bacterium]|nr:PQQ-binding-like beta-propeller repeat protein [Vicinamibacterales bacterium]
MPRPVRRIVSALALIVALLAIVVRVAPRVSGQAANAGFPSKEHGEWAFYNADIKGSRYMPFDQINASNFNKLEIAWHFKTDNLGPRPEYKLEGTPLMVKGTIYLTGGTRRAVVALDAKTGEQKWIYSMDEGRRADVAPRKLSGRGLSYWTDGKGDERIIFFTIGYRLVELDARTGHPVHAFAKGGVIDLKEGVVFGKLVNGKWQQVQIPLVEGEIGDHSTPLIVGDTIVTQSSMAEGLRYEYASNAKGLVRAYDVRTGKMLWRWNTMPGPGEPGNETWEDGSWNWTGNTGVWTEMSADPEAGLVYLPVESPTIDVYGGNRLGNNLYDTSLVAVDLKTGKKKWHFQLVHHDIWDYDAVGAPLLVDVTIDGKPRKIVAQPSKTGFLYVLDRVTGEPIWKIEEKPVPASDVPGEKASPTQPFPSKPPLFSRSYVATDDVIDFTPELRAQALENLKKYRWMQMPFVPYMIPNDKELGSILIATSMGGVNWPGSAFDPETGVFYTQADNAAVVIGAMSKEYFEKVRPETQKKQNYMPIWESESFGKEEGFGGGGRGNAPLYQGLGGLPIVKPPYGVITAIDLKNGSLKFQVPHGDTPDAVRNSPLLKGMTIPKTGQAGIVGGFVTKTLFVVGDPMVTAPPDRPRGAMLRAYDKENGKEVGAVWMPAQQSGNPMTYMIDGRQFVIVAVGGGTYTSEYIAYALPQSELPKVTTEPRR